MSEYATYDERKLLQVIAEALAGGGIAVTLDPGDVEIGAVEIKDGASDTRATVSASEPAANANGLVVRPVGQTALFGAVTETAPASDTASSGLNGRLQRIAQRLTSILASTLGFSVNAGTTDATTLRVITASDGPLNAVLGTTSGAKVITDANGSIQQYLRGIVHLLISILTVKIDQTTPGTTNLTYSKDAGAAWTSSFGVSSAAVVSADITAATAVTDAPTSGQKIVIDDIVVSTDTAMNILFEAETSGVDIFKVFLPANGTLQITPRDKVKLAVADKKLTAKASVAGNVGITVTYHSEA